MSTLVDRSVSGSTDWTEYEVILDVPPEAETICFGFLLSGTGTVWANSLRLEAVGEHVPADRPDPIGEAPAATHTDERATTAAGTPFVGRSAEQRQFADFLAALTTAPSIADLAWSPVMIVHGLGGLGKSTLAKQFLRSAQHASSTVTVWIDWTISRRRHPAAFAADPGPTFEAVLDELTRECLQHPVLAEALDPAEEPRHLPDPREVLASTFAASLRKAAARQPVLLILDTCEIVMTIGPWLRAIMRESGPRVGWVLCGRFESHDPAGSPSPTSSATDELHAFTDEVPAEYLHRIGLTPFDIETLHAYLTQAAPDRVASGVELRRLHSATSGIPLAVRIAAFLWASGTPIGEIDRGASATLVSPNVIASMTNQFLVHLNADDSLRSDLDRIYGLALALNPGDPDLISALWGTDDLVEAFDVLVRHHDFVLGGQYRLHDTVRSFLQRYLLEPFRRRELRPANQRAVALLEARVELHHQNLTTLAARYADERWISDVLALAWHRFWLDDEGGWATVQAAIPPAIAYNPSAGRAFLDVAGHFATTESSRHRLDLLRSTVGPISVLISRAGADGLAELSRSVYRARIEPDEGRRDELTGIVAWLHGQYALKNDRPSDAYRHLVVAARHAPPDAQRLRHWICRSLLTLSTAEAGARLPDKSMEVHTADLATRLEPASPEAFSTLGSAWRRADRPEEAEVAYSTAIELHRRSTDACHPDLAAALVGRCEARSALGRHDGAVSDGREAVEIYRELAALDLGGDRGILAGLIMNLGVYLSRDGQVAEAAATNAESTAIYRELATEDPARYHADLASALGNAAAYAVRLDRPDDAVAALQEIVGTYRRLAADDSDAYRQKLVSALFTLGGALTDLDRPAEARNAHGEAVGVYRGLAATEPDRYRPELRAALRDLGHSAREVRRFGAAVESFEEALALARADDDAEAESTFLGDLGHCYADSGEIARGAELFGAALASARATEDRAYEGLCRNNLGICFTNLGEHVRAVVEIQAAIEIAEELGDRNSEALRRDCLGVGLADQGDEAAAVDQYLAAIAIADDLGYRMVQTSARHDLATAYLHRAEWSAARAVAEEAIGHAERGELAEAHLVRGIALLRGGMREAAVDAFGIAVSAADDLIHAERASWDVLFSRGLAQCGLALLGGLSTDAPVGSFHEARAVTSALGVVRQELRLFDVLAAADDGTLAGVRSALIGPAEPLRTRGNTA